jgi:predicted membrane chloride channel (bestrophin family)
MRFFKSIFLIINYKTFIITALAVVSTWLCDYYNIEAEFPLTLIAIAIVFPVVFSIDSAYKRRERALGLLGDFKAHAMSIYHAVKDWTPNDEQYKLEIKTHLLDVYSSIREFFIAEHDKEKTSEKNIYIKMSELSVLLQKLRDFDLQAGEMSRINQYTSKILTSIENLKVFWYYRTPITLRAYSKVFIYSFPIIYGPFFVSAADHYSPGLEYVMPVIFSFILVSLDNIQGHLENPFDQIGEDDIRFDVEEFAELLEL